MNRLVKLPVCCAATIVGCVDAVSTRSPPFDSVFGDEASIHDLPHVDEANTNATDGCQIHNSSSVFEVALTFTDQWSTSSLSRRSIACLSERDWCWIAKITF